MRREYLRYFSLLILTFLVLLPVTVAAETYDPSVFSPSGTKYELRGKVFLEATNKTSGERLVYFNATANGTLILMSERMDLNFWKWSGIISGNITYISIVGSDYSTNTMGGEFPIPPLIAVKVNTREVYLLNIFELISGLGEGFDPSDILGLIMNFSTMSILEDYYATNPFYIPTSTQLNDVIPYFIWNKTANEAIFIINGTVVDEKELLIAGVSTDSWVVELPIRNFSDLSDLIYEQFGVNITEEIFGGITDEEESAALEGLLETLSVDIRFYYDKSNGWLLMLNASASAEGSLDISTEGGSSFTVDYTFEVNLVFELTDPGLMKVGGQGLISRYTGIPDYGILGLDAFLVIGLVYLSFFRKRY
ncbi:MAG: hypothetical protein ACTSR0_05950 [Candidatus Asgardarchaeia archaeon]